MSFSAAMARHFLAGFPLSGRHVIAGFWPIGSEADPLPLLEDLRERGHAVALPVVIAPASPLIFRLWSKDIALQPAGFGTRAPGPDAPEVLPDILLMPLLAYDRAGHRLGYGGGYYDRTLAHLGARPILVGFAFSGQEQETIPHQAHDVMLDAVVTERGLVFFSNRTM